MIYIYYNGSKNRKYKYAILIPKICGFCLLKIGDPKKIDYSEGGSFLSKLDFIKNSKGDTTKSGIYSKVFWERWLLNNKRSIKKSAKYMEQTFEIIIL